MLDTNDPLVILANNIDWSKFENEFKKYYKNENKGRPNKAIRLMVGLLLLKQLENLSDDRIIIEGKRNSYFQYFCGYDEFQTTIPCHSTLVKFRNRIGVKGFEYIFKYSIEIHNEKDIIEE